MPTYRDLYPEMGAVGERLIIKKLKRLFLSDCLLILSKASQHYYKYCQMNIPGVDGPTMHRKRCFELLSQKNIALIEERERENKKHYDVIFPELSMVYLIKICLQNCDASSHTKTDVFPSEVLQEVGECLLIANSLLHDAQMQGVPPEMPLDQMVVNFTKQVIADHNFDVYQKFHQTYFLYETILSKYSGEIDLEKIFQKLYGLTVKEYLAFSFAVLSQFVIKNTPEEDWGHAHFGENAFENLKPQFKKKLLEDLLINNINYKKLDKSYFNVFDITKRPLVRLEKGKIVVLSLKRLFNRLTDSVYFDILDNLSTHAEKDLFSKIFGKAVEAYFQDILENIDPKFIKPFKYNKDQQETPDGMLVVGSEGVFFECKKKQFHNLEFLKSGTRATFLERIKEFYHLPLTQLCKRIDDFRNELFNIPNLKSDSRIYPVIVCPLAPPIFSGGWDKIGLDAHVLPEAYKTDTKIASPEFMDLTELESIEEYLKRNKDKNFVDLIKIKRTDTVHHNANWMTILHKNNMHLKNERLFSKYAKEIETFGEILFLNTKEI